MPAPALLRIYWFFTYKTASGLSSEAVFFVGKPWRRAKFKQSALGKMELQFFTNGNTTCRFPAAVMVKKKKPLGKSSAGSSA